MTEGTLETTMEDPDAQNVDKEPRCTSTESAEGDSGASSTKISKVDDYTTDDEGETNREEQDIQENTDMESSNAVKTEREGSRRDGRMEFTAHSKSKRHKDALALRKRSSVAVKNPNTPYSSTLKRLKANERIKELSEEDYVSCLENIIERDYFPDLTKLRYINAIAEARAAGNTHMAQVLSERLQRVEQGELDETEVELKTLNKDGERVVVNLGKNGLKLNEFHRIFTSEDNRSFERLTKVDIEKSIQKTKWIEDSEYKHNLALADVQRDTELGMRSKSTASNKAVARNSLMFYPDGNIPSAPSAVRILSKNTSLNVDERMKELEDLQIEKRNELKKLAEDEEIANLVVMEGVAKHRDLATIQHSTNYGYVHTPKIVAGQGNTPLFTWGTIADVEAMPSTPLLQKASTPLVAGRSSLDTDGFQIPNAVPREILADKLYKKLSRKPSKYAKTPVTSSGNPNTPLIVQKLIAKHTKNVDMQLRDSYSGHKHRSRSSSVASSIASSHRRV
ncbi:conserved hypothetical protein [Theileria equi strain WA]|uniref:Nuclear protein Es2 n=1 Tax=Theileria equi strain WA TaxID=1537102 RepID=L1LFD5_THEEQ|nr:conserved hypothetical protein [Theileria equi strain WA]EKX73858.1 conserved hypothetical protein [Theileria equi strain WA]|eukprot:XP_004833310.1 conserved hypothetical protein [Theileria equi strain WA]